MKRLVMTLAAVGLAAGLSAVPSNAAILFTFDVGVNAPIPAPAPGDNGPHGPYTVSPGSVTVPGTGNPAVTYTITPNSTSGLGIFGELDASGGGADIVMANNQLFAPFGSAPATFNFGYSLDVRIFKDDNPADFADFYVNGVVTGNGVKNGGGSTFNVYESTIPQGVTTALSGTKFFLTRLDFTFPQAPPTAGGLGTPGAFSAHITAVPEPGPIALLSCVTVAGSAFLVRRRRSA